MCPSKKKRYTRIFCNSKYIKSKKKHLENFKEVSVMSRVG